MKIARKPERRSLPTPGDRRSKNEETKPVPQLDEDWDEPATAGAQDGEPGRDSDGGE